MSKKTLHLIAGLITLVVFLGTGAYMKVNFPEIYSPTEIIRYQFRANHIYILMSGLVNLVAGLYLRPSYRGWRATISWLSTILLIAAPLVLIAAFFIEPVRGIASRPITIFGVFVLFAGAVLAHMPGIRLRRTRETTRKVS